MRVTAHDIQMTPNDVICNGNSNQFDAKWNHQ